MHDVVTYYLSEHPGTTHALLKEAFSYKKNMDAVFLDYEEYLVKLKEKGVVGFFGKRPDVPTIQLADKKIVVCTNWPTMVNGKPADFALLLDVLRTRMGYKIENC